MRLLLVFALFVISIGVAVAVPSSCGVGPGEDGLSVTQTVTRDFGNELVEQTTFESVAESETVMRLLQRQLDVATRFGGGFVQSIEGFAGGRVDGRQEDWFFYVNGVESSEGAASRTVSSGDSIWWDLHDWNGVMRIPAVVGSFPEPFRSGIEGKRLPVRLDCQGSDRICDEVTERLSNAGVDAIARSTIQREVGPDLLRIVVGPWQNVRLDTAARVLEQEPSASGVFARFLDQGRRLAVYDERGDVVDTLTDGAGLVAAVRAEGQQPTWVVTGTDQAGVAGAAAMLQTDLLARRFAVTVEGGEPVGLPIQLPTGD